MRTAVERAAAFHEAFMKLLREHRVDYFNVETNREGYADHIEVNMYPVYDSNHEQIEPNVELHYGCWIYPDSTPKEIK